MAFYELKEDTFIGGCLRPAGWKVQYDGEAGENLAPSTRESFMAQATAAGAMAGELPMETAVRQLTANPTMPTAGSTSARPVKAD